MKKTIKKKIGIMMAAIFILSGSAAFSCQAGADTGSASKADSSSAEEGSSEAGETSYFLNIGSVSKMYTVTAVMQLADQGKVNIDAPVTEYIPEFKMADERYKDITVRMLMNHTSGLMGTIYGGGFLFDEKSLAYHDGFLERLRTQRLKYKPGAYNCYCNDGFTLLEILVERVSGLTFTGYLEKNICKPLSLENTGTQWSVPDMNAQVPCYINGNIQMDPECMQILGAGGITSVAEDVCSFGSAFFTGDNTLLSEGAKKEMAKNYAAGISGEDFGLGWDLVSKKDYEEKNVSVLEKGGDTNFQHAALMVAPDEKISAAVLSSGGSSGVNEELASELLDLALEEQGIKVRHPEKKKPDVVDKLPADYHSYEGLYANANMVVQISFPKDRYMQFFTMTNSQEVLEQYMYTSDGKFVKAVGDVESGKAIPKKNAEPLYFEEKGGKVYIGEEGSGYVLEKVPERDISDEAYAAWEKRNGVSYYYLGGGYSDAFYSLSYSCMTLNTNKEAKGYVNGQTIVDKNHAKNMVSIPGSASRDISDMEISREDGKEILTLSEQNTRYISEKNIPDFTDDITKVQTRTGAAAWYRINGLENETVTFDIPDHAAVYVYDQYGNIKYSSFMSEYNTGIPLPDHGMIVFIGDTGKTIGVDRYTR